MVYVLVIFVALATVSGMGMAADPGNTETQVSPLAPANWDEYDGWDLQQKGVVYDKLLLEVPYREFLKKPLPKGISITERVSAGIREDFLRYVPISPLDIQRIITTRKVLDRPIPSFLMDQHRRWLELHFPSRFPEGSLVEPSGNDIDPPGNKNTVVFPNVNVAHDSPMPPTSDENEIQLAVNPSNPRQMVASANSGGSPDHYRYGWPPLAIYSSQDGGDEWDLTWAPIASEFGLAEPENGCDLYGACDPDVVWDDQGRVFVQYMALCIHCDTNGSCSTADSEASMVSSVSLDGGQTWQAQGVVRDGFLDEGLNDKNFMTIDTTAVNPGTGEANPFYGNQYVCWDRSNNEKAAYSTDGGINWTEVNLPWVEGYQIGCDMGVTSDGIVHIAWGSVDGLRDWHRVYYSHSVDGGRTWNNPVLLKENHFVPFTLSPGTKIEAQNKRGASNGPFIAVDRSGGSCDGTVYVVYSDAPSKWKKDEADIYLIRSTDGGAMWSDPVLISADDTLSTQFHPIIVVDQENGDVVVAWQDTRNSDSNREIDIYLARSTDCGESFEAGIKVTTPSEEFPNANLASSDFNSRDNPDASGMQTGEYIGLDVHDGTAYVSWTDSREFYPVFAVGNQDANVAFGKVEFEASSSSKIFSDGFESGNLSAWN